MIAKCEVSVPYLKNGFIYIFCFTRWYIPNKMGKLHNIKMFSSTHYNLKNYLSKTLDVRIECNINYFSIHLFFSPSSLQTVIKLIIIIIIKHLQLFQ